MENIAEYIEFLVSELDRKKIEDYCECFNDGSELPIPYLPDLVLLMINSYYGAVETDIHWVTDLTMSDSIAISNGEFEYASLEKYIPARIQRIEDLCVTHKENEVLSRYLNPINEALECLIANHRRASSLLIITVIEGIVRSLGSFLAASQELGIDVDNRYKYPSLEKFLNNIPWKKDLPIDEVRYGLITGRHAMYGELKPEMKRISLNEKLCFLRRRFADTRNVVLHGRATDYADSLNIFLNLSALLEVLLTVDEYSALYGMPKDHL